MRETAERQPATRAERRALYKRVREAVSNTPLKRLEGIEIPNDCQIWFKAEYLNPSGSHYDREMLNLLEYLELTSRDIRPNTVDEDGNVVLGTRMLETTTGNSGSAFAWLCRVLGYPPPMIVIPADMPMSRKAQIASYGAQIVESKEEQYITGIELKFAELRRSISPEVFIPEHWEDEEHSVKAMEECGREILAQAARTRTSFDYFVLALGNGSSSRGIGNVLHPSTDTKAKGMPTLLGMEPAESQVVARWKENANAEDVAYAKVSHGIIGTGPARFRQLYPNMRAAAAKLDDILHVTTDEARVMQQRLADRAFVHVGMSSAACVHAIINFIESQDRPMRQRVFGTVFYDPAWKYMDYPVKDGA